MKSLVLVAVGVVGCWSGGKPAPAPPVPVEADGVRTCNEAAAGLERGTRGVRDPEDSVLGAMRARCLEDAWPAAAIDCFAIMEEGDLGRCVGELPESSREGVFAALGGGHDERTSIEISQARLANLSVGIVECDRFVASVSRALGCEQMPIATRAQLGSETADFWSLPTSNLPADAARRMADVCSKSLVFLQQQVADAGCMP